MKGTRPQQVIVDELEEAATTATHLKLLEMLRQDIRQARAGAPVTPPPLPDWSSDVPETGPLPPHDPTAVLRESDLVVITAGEQRGWIGRITDCYTGGVVRVQMNRAGRGVISVDHRSEFVAKLLTAKDVPKFETPEEAEAWLSRMRGFQVGDRVQFLHGDEFWPAVIVAVDMDGFKVVVTSPHDGDVRELLCTSKLLRHDDGRSQIA